VFGISSVLTPFFLGTVVGAVASGEVPADGGGDPTGSWTGVLPLLTGLMFVALAAYIAGAFLVRDAGAAGDEDLQRYFLRRSLVMAVIGGAAALAGIFALHEHARFIYDGLTSWPGIALVIGSGACGLVALVLLVTGRSLNWVMRPAAVGAVATVVWGYFAAAFPYMLPTEVTISDAAAVSETLTVVIVVFVIAAVAVVPSLILLYVLSQRQALE
jgi:cytochrome d ubiquinol oxidase subunit II